MQFQEKLMNQTWENGKKPSFKPGFGPFGLHSDAKNFLVGFTSTRWYALLQAIVVCNFKQNQQTKLERMWKKPSFRLNFNPFGPNVSSKNFFRGFYFY